MGYFSSLQDRKDTSIKTAIVGDLTRRDQQYLWHPLTQHKRDTLFIGLSAAKGNLLFDEEGNSYIDAIASWYCTMYGHCNDFIIEKVTTQLQKLDHVVFSSFTHEPAVRLAEDLIDILPSNLEKVFFSDNGSTAVEVAIKMCLQYYFNRGEKRTVLLALESGFHGDTFGAMSASGLSVYNGPFEEMFLDVERIPVPTKSNIDEVCTSLEKRLKQNDVAAFIYEPLVQGAAGMQVYDAGHLNRLLSCINSHKVLTIADEVMTGFGKTGSYFASDHVELKPDIICLSKALTAGITPMGATACTQSVYEAFLSDELEKGFFHGHTYTANPLACAAALAGIELLRSQEIQDNIARIIRSHEDFDARIRSHPRIESTRQCGVIYALDLKMDISRYGAERDKLYKYFLSKGVFLRPLGNTVYILPPYTIEQRQLLKVYDSIESLIDKGWD